MSEAWIIGPAGPVGDALAATLAGQGFAILRAASEDLALALGGGEPAVLVVLDDIAQVCSQLAPAGKGNGGGAATTSAGAEGAQGVLADEPGTDAAGENLLQAGTLEINTATYGVTIERQPVDFTYMEYELLKFFVTHPDRVFSRDALLAQVWGPSYSGGARTVDVHIRRVRAKLGPEHAERIRTLRSVGYRWDGSPA